jgi:hypothetical protein
MNTDCQLCALPPLDEDLSVVLAVVDAIPEGMRVTEFPAHCRGPECWCRPRIAYALGQILVSHKNLANGEFDS